MSFWGRDRNRSRSWSPERESIFRRGRDDDNNIAAADDELGLDPCPPPRGVSANSTTNYAAIDAISYNNDQVDGSIEKIHRNPREPPGGTGTINNYIHTTPSYNYVNTQLCSSGSGYSSTSAAGYGIGSGSGSGYSGYNTSNYDLYHYKPTAKYTTTTYGNEEAENPPEDGRIDRYPKHTTYGNEEVEDPVEDVLIDRYACSQAITFSDEEEEEEESGFNPPIYSRVNGARISYPEAEPYPEDRAKAYGNHGRRDAEKKKKLMAYAGAGSSKSKSKRKREDVQIAHSSSSAKIKKERDYETGKTMEKSRSQRDNGLIYGKIKQESEDVYVPSSSNVLDNADADYNYGSGYKYNNHASDNMPTSNSDELMKEQLDIIKMGYKDRSVKIKKEKVSVEEQDCITGNNDDEYYKPTVNYHEDEEYQNYQYGYQVGQENDSESPPFNEDGTEKYSPTRPYINMKSKVKGKYSHSQHY